MWCTKLTDSWFFNYEPFTYTRKHLGALQSFVSSNYWHALCGGGYCKTKGQESELKITGSHMKRRVLPRQLQCVWRNLASPKSTCTFLNIHKKTGHIKTMQNFCFTTNSSRHLRFSTGPKSFIFFDTKSRIKSLTRLAQKDLLDGSFSQGSKQLLLGLFLEISGKEQDCKGNSGKRI